MFEQPPTPEKKNRAYFESTASSKEFIAAKNFTEKFVDTGKFDQDLSEANIDSIRAEIDRLGKRLMPGADTEGILAELKSAGVITPVVVEKVKKEKPVEFIQTEYVSIDKPKQIEVDERQQQILEANLLHEEIEKANVFKSPEELDILYNQTQEPEKNTLEGEQYYYEFSKAGLIKGGDAEVAHDIEALNQRKRDFANKEEGDAKTKDKLERAKKIATLTERALAEGVTKFNWYGENVTIQPASEFDDVKRGIDDILEIRKEGEESSFMGLGIDVTFRGLNSPQFKDKFFRLLQSIHDGKKTQVKYFKNYNNELLKEFAIPKMVLYFNVNDVKDMVGILKNSDNAEMQQELEDHKQKFNVMRQIIHSCKILASFAEESQNNIFRKYVAVVNSLKEQAWENPDIKLMMDSSPDDVVSKHFEELIEEFKLTKQ